MRYARTGILLFADAFTVFTGIRGYRPVPAAAFARRYCFVWLSAAAAPLARLRVAAVPVAGFWLFHGDVLLWPQVDNLQQYR